MKKFKEMVTQSKVKVAAATTALSCSLPMMAYATESGGTAGLPAEVTAAITDGFTQMGAGATQVVILAVGAAVGVIVVSAGAKYALKQIKGVLSKAA